MAAERIDVANPEVRAALGSAAHLGRERWVPVRTGWEDWLYLVSLEREVREAVAQSVRPVAEQARALGLRRVKAADRIWSGTFGEV